jgi:cytochrome-b5 reductase
MLKEHMPAPAPSSMIYVCGPPPMYKAVCGPKGTKEDAKAQGPLGGMLNAMGYTNVFKF